MSLMDNYISISSMDDAGRMVVNNPRIIGELLRALTNANKALT
jgi:hypothetical protein